MNFNEFYLNEDICFIVFNHLNLKDKINFIQLNKYTRDNYLETIQNNVYDFINKDYHKFTSYLENMKYNEYQLKNIFNCCVDNVKYVYHWSIFYEQELKKIDLRYIFQLILNGLKNNNSNIKDEKLKKKVNEIYKCVSWSKQLTIFNVMDNFDLYVLHPNFNGYFK